jgi:Peptidase M50B-like
VVALQLGRRRGRARGSDADQLAMLTRVPGGLWVTFFAFVSLCMLGVGVWLLVPPGWYA